jgi:hypothetical protein
MELIVLITSIEFDCLGSVSRMVLRMGGSFLSLERRVLRAESCSWVGSVPEQEMDHLFEDAIFGQIDNVVASVVESEAEADSGNLTFACDDAFESLSGFGSLFHF